MIHFVRCCFLAGVFLVSPTLVAQWLDVAVASPVSVHVLVDLTSESARHYEEFLGVLLPFVVQRPGSVVSVWVLRDDLRTAITARVVVGRSPTSAPKLRSLFFERETARCLKALQWSSERLPRSSPIASGITRITAEPGNTLVVMSDGAEDSPVSSELMMPPSDHEWLSRLKREGLLQSDLTGWKITFVWCAPSVSARPRTWARHVRQQALWRLALEQRGATVRFFTGQLPATAAAELLEGRK